MTTRHNENLEECYCLCTRRCARLADGGFGPGLRECEDEHLERALRGSHKRRVANSTSLGPSSFAKYQFAVDSEPELVGPPHIIAWRPLHQVSELADRRWTGREGGLVHTKETRGSNEKQFAEVEQTNREHRCRGCIREVGVILHTVKQITILCLALVHAHARQSILRPRVATLMTGEHDAQPKPFPL
jgi:hypothetical protein